MTDPHHPVPGPRRELLRLLATTAGVWGLSGPITPRSAWAQAAPAGKAPELLRIGYQKSAVNLVILKQQGVLEKRFPQTKVSWVEFPAGPQLLEALSVGALEFGLTGDAPPVFAPTAGKELVYAGAEPLVQPRVITTGRGPSGHNLFYLASLPLATRHPDVIAALFEELTRAGRFARAQRPAAIKLISDFSGLDAGVVSLFLQRRPLAGIVCHPAAPRAQGSHPSPH
jgi:ABC-type nitrate/sulfonate/bicarbonate transport system substrate-binding protein